MAENNQHPEDAIFDQVIPTNVVESPESTSDQLHGHVSTTLAKPELDWDDYNDLQAAAKHPNMSAQTLESLYHRVSPKEPVEGVRDYDADKVIDSIIQHANTPKHIYEDVVSRHLGRSHRLDVSGLHTRVEPQTLEALGDQFVTDSKAKMSADSARRISFSPDFYLKHFEAHKADTLDQTDENSQLLGRRRDLLSGLTNTKQHSKESLDRTIATLVDPRNPPHVRNTAKQILQELPAAQSSLTKEHLDHIAAYLEANEDDEDRNYYSRRDGLKDIASHPNTDASLLARFAAADPEDYNKRELRDRALRNPNTPKESRLAAIERMSGDSGYYASTGAQALVSNPSVTTDEVNALFDKGFQDTAVRSDKLDAQRYHAYVQEAVTDTNKARNLLNNKSLSPGVLTSLVAHKNQNVAMEALEHPQTDISVLNAALKRKAKKVQDAAARHPLVAKQQLVDRLKSGKLPAAQFISKDNLEGLGGEIPQDAMDFLNKEHSIAGQPDDYKASDADFWKVKGWLADKSPDHAIKTQNRKEIADRFLSLTNNPQEEYSERDHRFDYARQILGYATDGDRAAQSALLARPKFLVRTDFDHEGLSPDFLRSAHETLKTRNIRDDEDYGRAVSAKERAIHRIYGNTNTPEEVFEGVFNDTKFFADQDSYRNDRYDISKGTIFDNRWSELPDVQRDEKFQKLLSMEHEDPTIALLQSNSVSPQLWRTGWEALGATRQQERANHFIHNIKDPQIGAKILSGDFQKNDKQTIATELDNDDKSRATIRHYVDSIDQAIATGWAGFSKPDIAAYVNGKVFQGADGQATLDHAFNKDKSIGMAFAVAKAKEDAGLSDRYSYEDDTKRKKLIKSLSDQVALQATRMGEEPNGPYAASIWMKSLDWMAHSELFKKMKGTGALDFLANHPGDMDPEAGRTLQASAIAHGFISPEMATKLSAGDPLAFQAFLATATKKDMAKAIVAKLKTPEHINPEVLSTIISHYEPNLFVGAAEIPKGIAHMAERVAVRKAGLSQIMHLAAQHELTDKLPFLAKMATYSESAFSNLSAQGKKEMASFFMEELKKLPLDEETKGQLALESLKELGTYAPAAARRDIAKEAITKGHLKTLKVLAERFNDSRAKTFLVKQATKNKQMTDDQFVASLEAMPHLDNATQFKAVSDMAIKHITRPGVSDEAKDAFIAWADEHTRKFESRGYIKQLASPLIALTNDPNDNIAMDAAHTLLRKLGANNIDMADRINMYKAIPADRFQHLDLMSEVDPEIANNPEIIGDSASGWKLGFMSHAVSAMDKENASIVTNRILSREGLDSDIYSNLAMNLLHNVYADAKDIVNAHRAIGHNDISEVIALSKSYGMNMAIMPVAYQQVVERIDKIPESPMTSEDQRTYANRLDAMSRVLSQAGTYNDEHKTNLQEGLHASVGAVKKLLSHVASSSSRLYKDTDLNAIHTHLSVANSVALEGMRDGHITDPQTQLDVLHNNKTLYTMHDKLGDPDASDYARNSAKWMESAKNLEREHWGEAFKAEPELAASLSVRDSIDKHLFDAANFESILTQGHKEVLESLPQLAEKITDKDRPYVYRRILDLTGSQVGAAPQAVAETVQNIATSRPESVQYKDFLHFYNELKPHTGKRHAYPKDEQTNLSDELMNKCVASGAGGSQVYQFAAQKCLESKKIETAEQVLRSPHIDSHYAGEIVKSLLESTDKWDGSNRDRADLTQAVIRNPSAPTGLVDQLSENYPDDAIMHQNLSKSKYDHLLATKADSFDTHSTRSKAYRNPKWGGQAFRALPPSLPKNVRGIEPDQLIQSVDHSIQKERLSSILPQVPAGGLHWAQFKKANPKLEHVPEIKQLFMSQKNQTVLPEHVAEAVKNAENPFHITYGEWKGIQRHMSDSNPNLVLQINLGAKMDDELMKDPDVAQFYNFCLKSFEGHPITSKIASWLRVDTVAGKKGWIIEEFQSDFGPTMGRIIDSYTRGGHLEMNGRQLTKERAHEVHDKIVNAISGWYHAGLKGIEELAKKQGIESLYIHGPGIRGHLSGWNSDKDVPVRAKEMYDKHPQKLGWEKIDYSDYPRHSEKVLKATSDAGFPTHCWKKPLK